jgi:hypothetical protein
LTTKDHFSSNWTSWVAGGKSHEFVVSGAGVRAGPQGVADDGVFIDTGQAGGLAHAAAVLEVPEDAQGLFRRESGAEQGGAFALREAVLTGAAGEQATLLVGAVAEADAEVPTAAEAVVRAVGILATEALEVFHEDHLPNSRPTDGQPRQPL